MERFSQDELLEYFKQAYDVAIERSTDPSTKNGAVLVDPFSREVLAKDANRFPDGVEETEERWTRPLKYSIVEHAERNVIYTAARHGIITDGLIMVGLWLACADCARAIIQAGIRECYTLPTNSTITHTRWNDSISIADIMLKEAGVSVHYFNEPLGLEILRNENTILI